MVNKWDIYFCCLDPVVGSEQKGTRPVLIISTNAVNHNLPVATVLPLSSVKPTDKIYPTEILLDKSVTGLPKLSVAMFQQIRTVSHNRLQKLTGRVTDTETQEKILEACRSYFDLY
jgi:mRNA interferase MazF